MTLCGRFHLYGPGTDQWYLDFLKVRLKVHLKVRVVVPPLHQKVPMVGPYLQL